jgi:PEP-CTERM motif
MRLRLLLIFLLAIAAMGADCGGGGGSQGNASTGSSFSASVARQAEEPGGNDFTAPVPEPSAAIVFGVGLLAVGAALRRLR